jgi:DNA polymerase III delta prime subunit
MDKMISTAGRRLSHAYIIASASEAERDAMANRLAAEMLCEGEGCRPCGTCRHCRKVLAGIHPDVITVERETDDKGGRKREIHVGRIRAIVSDAQVMPNEALAKVYVIKDADCMNGPAQNAMLKLLEEPPKSALFILCASNPENLLQTVRSRCVLLRSTAEGEEDGEATDLARAYLELAARGDRAALLRWCAEREGMDPARTEALIRAVRYALADIICGRGEIKLSSRRCVELDGLFSRCERFLKLNTGTRHILGLLAADGIGGE